MLKSGVARNFNYTLGIFRRSLLHGRFRSPAIDDDESTREPYVVIAAERDILLIKVHSAHNLFVDIQDRERFIMQLQNAVDEISVFNSSAHDGKAKARSMHI
jgi:hypothetical protein